MRTITVPEAFSNAPPRSAAVVCLKGSTGETVLQLADWFTWLNIKRNPMISFSLPRASDIAKDLREDDILYLAFPPLDEAKGYREAVRARADDDSTETIEACGVSVPKGCEVLLKCSLAGAYNYPFKKVRIFNCNLEEAMNVSE